MSTDERIIEVNNTELSETIPLGDKCYQKNTFKCPFIEIRTEKISPCMENSGATQAIYVQCTKFGNWDIRVSIHKPKTAWNKLNYCESGFTPQDKRDDENEITQNEKLYKLKHEVLHIILSPITNLAAERFTTEEALSSSTHAVLQKLMKLLPVK